MAASGSVTYVCVRRCIARMACAASASFTKPALPSCVIAQPAVGYSHAPLSGPELPLTCLVMHVALQPHLARGHIVTTVTHGTGKSQSSRGGHLVLGAKLTWRLTIAPEWERVPRGGSAAPAAPHRPTPTHSAGRASAKTAWCSAATRCSSAGGLAYAVVSSWYAPASAFRQRVTDVAVYLGSAGTSPGSHAHAE